LSHAEALRHLRAGRPQAAAELLTSHLHREPADAQGWFLLGACRHALNELPAASKALFRSLALDPGNTEAHLALVSVLRSAGESAAALTASRTALARFPRDAHILYAAALCFEDVGQPSDALAHYDAALQVDHRFEDALHNRGLLLARLGRFEEAEANQRSYIARHAGSARAHSGLADMLVAQGRFGEALDALHAVESRTPDDVSVHVRQGVAVASLGRFEEARELFAEVRSRDPRALERYLQRIAPGADPNLMLSPQNLFFWQCHLSLGRCDWTQWSACADELRRLTSAPDLVIEPAVAFISFHMPVSGAVRHRVARHIATAIESRTPALPHQSDNGSTRIRIGVLSPDLREHLNGYLLLPLFQLLDRARFELYAYSLAEEDDSSIRRRLVASADHFRDLHTLPDLEAACAIREDDIDLLIDAAGHTTGGRFAITAMRPARVQVLYLAFAGSLGSSRVDYAITDAIVGSDPEEWSEERVFLPHTYYLYDFREPAPETDLTRRDYGLPQNAFVYCAFHKAEKISPDTFALWMRILARVPRAVLWMLTLSDAAQRNLRHEAARHGVDPARLIFAPFDPRDRYLARQRLGDLMLDAIHHSAMTTACDAMAAGLPVLTLRGSAMASRAGESLARAAGVPGLVALKQEEFVEKAVRLASDPDRLAGYRRVLLSRKGPLFDTAGRVREIEEALLEMWDRYLNRSRPA
jgi:predicted O-linked N-acetylglucosamine transferase (SPINDLY family)